MQYSACKKKRNVELETASCVARSALQRMKILKGPNGVYTGPGFHRDRPEEIACVTATMTAHGGGGHL
jgi:hypothetical protein